MHMQRCFGDPSALATRTAWYMAWLQAEGPGVSGTVPAWHSEVSLLLSQSEPPCNALGYVHVTLRFLAQRHPQ